MDLFFDDGDTIELHKGNNFDGRIDLRLQLQNGDSCYNTFPFTIYLEIEDPNDALRAWDPSSSGPAEMPLGEELAVNFNLCQRTRVISFAINLNNVTVGAKVVTFRAVRTEVFGEPEPRITVVNAARLIVETPPGPPTDLSARPGFEKVLLRWTAPASNGGADISFYEYEQNGSGTWIVTVGIGMDGTATSHTVTGLTNGQAYTFRVRAGNYAGSGAASAASASVTPAVDTTPPVLLSAAVDGNEVTLEFDEAVRGGDSKQLRRGHFHARVDGKQGLLSVQEIAYGGSTVTLTLDQAQAVTSEDMFSLHYYQETRQGTQLASPDIKVGLS